MRLIEHPAANLAQGQHLFDRPAAQLLGRNVQNGDIPHAHALHDLPPFGRRQQTINRRGKGGPGIFHQVVHLVFHQGLQRRNHHSQQTAAHMARQGRQLIAQGFSATRRQDRQQGLVLHAFKGHRPLQALTLPGPGHAPKGIEAEKALQLEIGIMGLPAIRTPWIAARDVAQCAQKWHHFGKLVPGPWREH